MAHNTHFFFKTISPTYVPMPKELARDFSPSFSSIATLRQEFILTASSMFGPGFVWLVKVGTPSGPAGSLYQSNGLGGGATAGTAATGSSPYAPFGGAEYKILTTYLAGTPYPGAHWRKQDTDMNTVGAGGSAAPYLRNAARAQQTAGNARSPGSLEVVPVLCLSTWEHAWLRDYGVGGKRAFAEAWWETVDWRAVADLAAIRARPAGVQA